MVDGERPCLAAGGADVVAGEHAPEYVRAPEA